MYKYLKNTELERECSSLLQKEYRILKSIKRELRDWDSSKIYMRRKNEKPKFSRFLKGREKFVRKNDKSIDKLLRYELANEYEKALEHNYNLLKNAVGKFRKVDISRIKPILDERGISENYYTIEQQRWMKNKASSNYFKNEEQRRIGSMGTFRVNG